MANWRIKSLDTILATAEKKPLTRSLGAFQLTMLGIGGTIGTGIFVLTASAATKAGPAMMISFAIAGFVCFLTALAYAELCAMIPVSGSAYTFTYATFGEILAWIVGWALVLEYAIAASAVAVGWSGYMVGLAERFLGANIPDVLVHGPFDKDPGLVNLPAMFIALAMAALLIVGTKESARFNAVLVMIKIAALLMFLVLAMPEMNFANFSPFMPRGFFAHEIVDPHNAKLMISVGVSAAAATIFFAFVGFDAVSTAAEETINPNRNIPIGLIGALGVSTVLYMLVAAAATGSVGADPMGNLARSNEALAYVLQEIGYGWGGNLLAIAAGLALPSVILTLMYGQTRIFFVMARDGLLPPVLSRIHPKFQTPHVITALTGGFVAVFASFFPVESLAEISNSGTLLAFMMVAIGVLVLRRRDPDRNRPFRTPVVWVTAPLAAAGCAFLFFSLSNYTLMLFVGWVIIGLVIYFSYSRSRSHQGRGLTEVHELDDDVPTPPAQPLV
ncbi:amino acid permease [Polymorphobacter glacialis]|uniref:Amino acid permease n=1 Tax=Sandarakinorhabdus glacialis TaxID=1614636 RepID=A0A916ZR11_9SPHN|nr:amino acid permease [Polymorphobacter glacialis]GGE09969.1 amino acid permease [Polymorphobacter glacialis]